MEFTLQQQLQQKTDQKTKPPGALGMLEDVAMQVGLIQQTLYPKIVQPHIVVFAADHGIAAIGLVNPYPQAVTAQMVMNFVNGGAAINVFCRHNAIGLVIADAGVNAHFEPTLPIIHAKIRNGTNSYLTKNAMTIADAKKAITLGKNIVADIAANGCNTIGFGEMGIGNTSSAALIMHQLLNIPLEACTGRGTGSSDEQYRLKLLTLKTVASFHQLGKDTIPPIDILRSIGGFEIAMMVGAYLQAAKQQMVIVADGFIATAALLLATNIMPEVLKHCIFSHCSEENGHRQMLSHLGATPLLQLNMRLGEGTGSALAIPLVQNAVQFFNEMASFQSAGVHDALVP